MGRWLAIAVSELATMRFEIGEDGSLILRADEKLLIVASRKE